MKQKVTDLIKSVLDSKLNIEVEVPGNEKFGDYATNIAIIAAKSLKQRPSDTAKDLASRLSKKDNNKYFSSIEPTQQGFVNFRVNDSTLHHLLGDILKKKDKFGISNTGNKQKVLIEFVSANPTGPLHIGHGRWAVIGDCLANTLKAAGYKVDKEFYVNDAGEQVEKLVLSVLARAKGVDVPEGGYGGSYVNVLAEKYGKEKNIKEKVLGHLLKEQRKTLADLGVTFDKWFFESELHRKNRVKNAVSELDKKGLTFHEGSALWFKSSQYGDDKNRVLIKDDGSPTYFAADIAYHMDKFNRKYDRLINVWGTDHHGYVARLTSALTALGYPADKLKIIIGQLVALYRGKELVRMSKRTGEMITLDEVVSEIGKDATRYFLVKTSPNTHIDFDLELAKSKSLDNPVYYVSYAHARICSILKEAKAKGFSPDQNADLSVLATDEERRLMLKLLRYGDEIISSANHLQPHRLTAYAEELASIFHNYYHQHRVITDDRKTSTARLTLCDATSIVLKNVLKLLGISAPERM